jgi:hypothetical protein
MNTKVCTGPCGRELPATTEFFHKSIKRGEFGFRSICRECYNKKAKEKNNPINTDASIKQVCTGDCGNEFPATLDHFYRSRGGKFGVTYECKKCFNKRIKQWKKNNKDKVNEYQKGRYHNNEQFRIRHLLSTGLSKTLNNIGQSKNASTLDYIGCDIEFLKQHLNSTKHDSWGDVKLDIDHIIPQSLYDFTKEEEIKKVYNWRNLRYLPQPENRSKGDILDIALVKEYGIDDLLPSHLQ